MDVTRTPRSVPGFRLLLLALAALSLIAGACGTDTATSPAEAAVDTVADLDGSAEVDAGAAPETASNAAEESVVEESMESDGAAASASQPIAFARSAVAASQAQAGYRIDQGMAMRMSLLNGLVDMNIAPEGPIATGEVSGDSMHLTMDMGAFVSETMEATSFGVGPSDADIAEMTALLDGAAMESWQVGSTLYMDMSGFLGGIEDDAVAESDAFAALAGGPVRIELDELGLTGAEAAGALSQGMSIVDPASLLESLVSVDALSETGTSTVRGVETTVYSGSATMTAYAEATGANLTDQLGPLGDLGFGDADSIAALLDDMTVDITAMVDDNDLVRRIEVVLDMAPMLTAMFSDPGFLGEATGETPSETELAQVQAFLGDDMVFVTETWQEFYDYGEQFVIEPPADATDITDDYFDIANADLLDA